MLIINQEVCSVLELHCPQKAQTGDCERVPVFPCVLVMRSICPSAVVCLRCHAWLASQADGPIVRSPLSPPVNRKIGNNARGHICIIDHTISTNMNKLTYSVSMATSAFDRHTYTRTHRHDRGNRVKRIWFLIRFSFSHVGVIQQHNQTWACVNCQLACLHIAQQPVWVSVWGKPAQ